MRNFITAVAATAILTMPSFAHADGVEDPIFTMPAGQVLINISATVSEEVKQDLLVATLQYNAENREASKVQNEINTAMKKALDLAQKQSDIKVTTGSYNVYERRVPKTDEKVWYGQQTITIKSKKSDVILDVAGKMQDLGLKMNGLNYMVDPKDSVAIKDVLMEKALQELSARANRAAKALGKSGSDIREVNIQSSGSPRPYAVRSYAKMEMASDSMAAPVAAAGESTISMTVSGRAILKP